MPGRYADRSSEMITPCECTGEGEITIDEGDGNFTAALPKTMMEVQSRISDCNNFCLADKTHKTRKTASRGVISILEVEIYPVEPPRGWRLSDTVKILQML